MAHAQGALVGAGIRLTKYASICESAQRITDELPVMWRWKTGLYEMGIQRSSLDRAFGTTADLGFGFRRGGRMPPQIRGADRGQVE